MDKRKAAAIILLHEQKIKKRRSCWTRKWILRRGQLGACSTLMQELRMEDPIQLKLFLRMSATEFEDILSKVGPSITKQETIMRSPIPPKDKLAVTLRFLASGDSFTSLGYLFRFPQCTISRFIPEVCEALFNCLKDDYLKVPDSQRDWLQLAERYQSKWNFPNCIGSLDGKHIVMQSPAHAGSYFFNYKKTHSIVLLALVDADYQFIYVDAGCNGRISDGGVFSRSALYTALSNGSLSIPPSRNLPDRDIPIPYVIVADDAFPLRVDIMKPYPHKNQPVQNRVFNYRLSRARRCVENAFGILSSVFRVFRRPILLNAEKCQSLVLVSCCLHNYLLRNSRNSYAPIDFVDHENENGELTTGTWRAEPVPVSSFLSLPYQGSNNFSMAAREVREEFNDYFVSPDGELIFQYSRI